MISQDLTYVNTPSETQTKRKLTPAEAKLAKARFDAVQQFIENAEKRYSIIEVFRTMTGEMPVKKGRDWRATCPFHTEAGDKNFALFYGDHGWGWRCHSRCQKGGDLIDLVGKFIFSERWKKGDGPTIQTQMEEVMRWLGAGHEIPEPPKPIEEEREYKLRCSERDVLVWHDLGKDAAHQYWCGTRGLAEDAIATFQLGFDAKTNRYTIPSYWQGLQAVQRRIDPVVEAQADAKRREDIARVHRIFPDLQTDEEIIAAAKKANIKIQPEIPRYKAVAGSRPVLFNWDNAMSLGLGKVLFVEGQADCMSGFSNAKLPCISQTLGAGSITTAMIRLIQTVPEIYICFDPDSAGAKATDVMRAAIARSRAIPLPPGAKDFDECIVNGGAAYFRERMGIRTHSMWGGLDLSLM